MKAIKLGIFRDSFAQKRCVNAVVQGGVNAHNQFREGGHLVIAKALEVTSFRDIVAPCFSNLSFWKCGILSHSRSIYEEYLDSIQNEEAAPKHVSLDFESDEDDGDDVNDKDNVAQIYFYPVPIYILKGFNDDEEVLVIGWRDCRVKRGKGRITLSTELPRPNDYFVNNVEEDTMA
ncbi:hypothetical protein Cgig2_002036 [Carnegiea gigantea]|uniref:Uncharacterized protein n=1 Tax=Carnegiea gigantea TaxID=171969 RepID=A0A9Q1QCV7_9CARY|nr:hypothetical protein Cgig2_002036 [Carnegiea gigantea]